MTQRDVQVARTIKEQVGMMTAMACGARQFVALESGLMFRVGGGQQRKVRIMLNAMDTYDVEVGHIKRGTFDWVTEREERGIYCDELSTTVYDLVNRRAS